MDNQVLTTILAALGTILVAVISALAGIAGTYLSNRNSREQERRKSEQELSRTRDNAERALQLERQKHEQALELERQKLIQELRGEYDKELLKQRIAAYQALWQITGTFPRYGRDELVTIERTRRFSVEMRKWYFEKGGIFFTVDTREANFDVQKCVKGMLEGELRDQPADLKLPSNLYDSIRDRCSTLRSTLVASVGTRRESDVNGRRGMEG